MLSLWHFMAWRDVGTFAMSFASSRLGASGTRLAWSDVSEAEGGFTVRNFSVKGGADLNFRTLTIRPRVIASVLSLAPVCDISFTGGNVRLGMTINFGDGRVLLTAGSPEAVLEDIRTNGDFAVSGMLAVNPSAMRITRANARLSVPENFSQNMGMFQSFLPLVNEGGQWYLRR